LLAFTFGRAGAAMMGRALVAFGPRGTKFLHRQLAIAVLVEGLEGGAGVGEFGFVNHAVVVGVEDGDEGRERRPMAFPTWFAGTGRRFVARGRTLPDISLRRTGTAGLRPAFGAFGPRRAEFVPREFAIAVLVECFEGGAGVGDFGFVDHAVFVGVEGSDDRRRRRTLAV
jgi:hypothetical protein